MNREPEREKSPLEEATDRAAAIELAAQRLARAASEINKALRNIDAADAANEFTAERDGLREALGDLRQHRHAITTKLGRT